MSAKSIIKFTRARLISGAWTQQLRFIPVAMALTVAALPFTLTLGVESSGSLATPSTTASDTQVSGALDDGFLKTTVAPPVLLPDDRRYAVVADYMARRFFVSRLAMLDLVKTAHVVGRKYNLDPMLLVAVMAVESSFNPIAESVAGARGLMQIIPHYHLEKFAEFGGEQTIFDPRINITVGAKIIREYLQSSSGDLFTALQTYAGALPDRDTAYTHKVLNEKDRLDTLMGLPKTDRGGRIAQAAPAASALAVQPAPGGRVQMMIPTSGNAAGAGAGGAPQPAVAPPPDAVVRPAEPLATLPSPVLIAANRRAE